MITLESEAMTDKLPINNTVLPFDTSKKKPHKIEEVLPWPPYEGLMKEMEQGVITEATFAIPIVIKGDSPTDDEIKRRMENKRKL